MADVKWGPWTSVDRAPKNALYRRKDNHGIKARVGGWNENHPGDWLYLSGVAAITLKELFDEWEHHVIQTGNWFPCGEPIKMPAEEAQAEGPADGQTVWVNQHDGPPVTTKIVGEVGGVNVNHKGERIRLWRASNGQTYGIHHLFETEADALKAKPLLVAGRPVRWIRTARRGCVRVLVYSVDLEFGVSLVNQMFDSGDGLNWQWVASHLLYETQEACWAARGPGTIGSDT